MSKIQVLIAFASRYGQTRKIAAHIARLLERSGAQIELLALGEEKPARPLSSYDGIVLGSAVFAGKHLATMEKFIRLYKEPLNRVYSAFFSVSGSAGGPTEKERNEAARCVDELVRRTGWSPQMRGTFGGALSFSRYGWFVRFIVRQVLRSQGQTLDWQHDMEYTDWSAVDRFAQEFIGAIAVNALPEFAERVGPAGIYSLPPPAPPALGSL